MDLSELKSIILNLVRSHPNRRVSIIELKNDLRNLANIELGEIAKKTNFKNAISLILSFNDKLKVTLNGEFTQIEAIPEDDAIKNPLSRYTKKRSQAFFHPMTSKYNEDRTTKLFVNEEIDISEESDFDSIFKKNSPDPLILPPEEFLTDDDALETSKDVKEIQEMTEAMTLNPSAPPGSNFVKTLDKVIPSASAIQYSTGSDVKKIIVLEAVNPHRFWFSEISQHKNHVNVVQKMKEFYNQNVESFRINSIDLQNGLHVAVFRTESWHRAKVLKISSEKLIRVFFVDFGSVDEVELKNLRYMKEEFMDFPSIAQRGVLSFIQPKHPKKFWSNEAKQFFLNKLSNQTVSAKFFYVNSYDNSYYLGIKLKVDSSAQELIANQMIEKDLGAHDSRFLMRGTINQNEISFDEYENGKWFEISTAFKLQMNDSWVPIKVKSGSSKTSEVESIAPLDKLPSFRFNPARLNQSRAPQPVQDRPQGVVSTLSSFIKHPVQRSNTSQSNRGNRGGFRKTPFSSKTFVPSFTTTMPNINPQFIPQIEENNINVQQSSACLVWSSSSSSENGIKMHQIEPQSLETMVVGREILISVQVLRVNMFYELSNFYFYDTAEAFEIKNFLNGFNNCYEKEKKVVKPSDIQVGCDVVVVDCKNYCRGRILAPKSNNTVMIFLLDFGTVVYRLSTEIYYLKKDFMHRQAAVYKGAFIQESQFNKNDLEQTLINNNQCVFAKIMSVGSDDGRVNLKFVQ